MDGHIFSPSDHLKASRQLSVPLSSPTYSLYGTTEGRRTLPCPQMNALDWWKPVPPSPIMRYRAVWRRAFFKIKVRHAIRQINQETIIYGTNNDLVDLNHHYKPNIDLLITKKTTLQDFAHLPSSAHLPFQPTNRLLLYPNGRFRQMWNAVLLLFMLYTATIVPYRIAFEDPLFWDVWTVMDALLDAVFCMDIAVNFCSVRETPTGQLETRRKTIAVHYLKSWFLLDFLSSFPTTAIDYAIGSESSVPTGKYNSLMRLVRLPRVYKLIRIFRIAKIIKYIAENALFQRVQDGFQRNSSKI